MRIELGYNDETCDYVYRIDDGDWIPCEDYAGFTPVSDKAEHFAAAVVAIAFAHDWLITEGEVMVNGLYASWATEPSNA